MDLANLGGVAAFAGFTYAMIVRAEDKGWQDLKQFREDVEVSRKEHREDTKEARKEFRASMLESGRRIEKEVTEIKAVLAGAVAKLNSRNSES